MIWVDPSPAIPFNPTQPIIMTNCHTIPTPTKTQQITTTLTKYFNIALDLFSPFLYILDVFSDMFVTFSYLNKPAVSMTIFWLSLGISSITPLASLVFAIAVARDSYTYSRYSSHDWMIMFICIPVLPLYAFVVNYWNLDMPLNESQQNYVHDAQDENKRKAEALDLETSRYSAKYMADIVSKTQRELGLLFEVVVESIPQSILQFYVLLLLNEFDHIAVISIAFSSLRSLQRHTLPAWINSFVGKHT
eukprot:TRINITY_DN1456_c0_g1_i8.p1 TRINITY_DN1456_c0_g1~~TRINITY_DN1456_c0_g1_i8.p1  ORF type:complete len:248 (-),score=40.07 TRINITY_DN1456_c0_g1_i8:186-929(-)